VLLSWVARSQANNDRSEGTLKGLPVSDVDFHRKSDGQASWGSFLFSREPFDAAVVAISAR
jgi:hypothetical protein